MPELSLSVVIPTYNRAHLISRALASAIRETKPGDEMIVIDDGSSDNTEAVVKRFDDVRIRYVRQSNQGAGAARNRGAQEASGDLLAYLDSDDEWLPGKIIVQRRLMTARPEVLFCFTDFARVFDGRTHKRSIRTWHTDPRGWDEIMGPS